MKTALIVGSTGLVGNCLLKNLLEDKDYIQVIAISRQALKIQHPKLRNIIKTDFLSFTEEDIEHVDVLYSCLGTTRKKTPDLKQYREIEIDIPCHITQIAANKGLQSVHYISAAGVAGNSSNFYLKIKYEAEKALQQTDVARIHIYQPGLLKGDRSETRFGESIANLLSIVTDSLLFGKARKYHSIYADQVAKAMIKKEKTDLNPSVYYYEYDQMI